MYAPTQIIDSGVSDARETFAHLYIQLDELRREAATYYHRAFVVDQERADENDEPRFHPAPPGFGGNELACRAPRVNLARLTDAGLALYAHGVRTALAERDELLAQIDAAEHDLERMMIAMDGTIAHVVSAHLRATAATDYRGKDNRPAATLQAWDVPVRRPGTGDYLPPEAGR